MKNKLHSRIKVVCTLLPLIYLNSCLNLSSCNSNVEGEYTCEKQEDVKEYLKLNSNGTYVHYIGGEFDTWYKGNWEWINDGYCNIELVPWFNFEQGKVEEYNNQIYISENGYLNPTLDGRTLDSFIKTNQ